MMRSNSPYVRWALTGAVSVGIAAFFYWADQTWNEKDVAHWWAVLPPLVAVAMAIGTRRILLSLLTGVVLGGFLASFHAEDTATGKIVEGLEHNWRFFADTFTSTWNLQVLTFIVCMIPLIMVTMTTGGLQKLLHNLAEGSKSRRMAQLYTAILGLILFIDDYSNTMLVGTTMRPMTDRYRISREKLAYLVDSTAAPIAGIALLSTWVGTEAGLISDAMKSLEIDKEGYTVFLEMVPLRFYCLFTLVFVFMIALTGRDYGPMLRAEKRAAGEGKLWDDEAAQSVKETEDESEDHSYADASIAIALIPIIVLFGVFIGGMWIDGKGTNLLSWEEWKRVLAIDGLSTKMLAVASVSGLLIAMLCAWWARVPKEKMDRALGAGIRIALLPISILVCAWALQGACGAVQTDDFLVDTFAQKTRPEFFPLIAFMLACFTAFATGTSWGTMGILIPVIAPMAFALGGDAYGPIMVLSLAAVLDGAIFGDHCSPISDTTIMSSTSSRCDHLHHVRTQIPYALTVALIAGSVGYIGVSMGMHFAFAYVIAVPVMFMVIRIVGRSALLPGPRSVA